MIEDEIIETKVAANMRSQSQPQKVEFSVISHNGVVLGGAGYDFLRARATEGQQGQRKNQTYSQRVGSSRENWFFISGNDAWIATKIRTLMLTDKDVPASQVKVVTKMAQSI